MPSWLRRSRTSAAARTATRPRSRPAPSASRPRRRPHRVRELPGRKRPSKPANTAMPRHVPQATSLDLQPHQIVIRPLVTEKGMHRSTRNNAYAFEVNRLANKGDVQAGGRRVVQREGAQGSHAEPQGQAAADEVPPRPHRPPGRRRSSRWTPNTGLISSRGSCQSSAFSRQ